MSRIVFRCLGVAFLLFRSLRFCLRLARGFDIGEHDIAAAKGLSCLGSEHNRGKVGGGYACATQR